MFRVFHAREPGGAETFRTRHDDETDGSDITSRWGAHLPVAASERESVIITRDNVVCFFADAFKNTRTLGQKKGEQ